MKALLTVLFFYTLSLSAEDFCNLECEELHFESKKGLLTGTDVALDIQEGIHLTCHQSQIDRSFKHGIFTGGLVGEYALIEGHITPQHGLKTPFIIKCHRFDMNKEEEFTDILAQKEVSIICDEKYEASSDFASYHFDHNRFSEGIIHLFADEHEKPCQVLSITGDRVQGKQAWIDLNQKTITIDQSRGQVLIPNSEHEKIDFAAKTMTLLEQKKQVSLDQEVVVNCKGLGTLCADTATLEYDTEMKNPTKVSFRGNVRMCNQFASTSEFGSPLDQYALADTITYNPVTKKLKMRAKKGNRVLFYDKANHLKISAPMITIEDQNKVKGHGDVRFQFAEQELEELRKEFPVNF